MSGVGCGHENHPGRKFCAECGAALAACQAPYEARSRSALITLLARASRVAGRGWAWRTPAMNSPTWLGASWNRSAYSARLRACSAMRGCFWHAVLL